jgi:hypothetical protein
VPGEIPAPAFGERFERDLVADAFPEHERRFAFTLRIFAAARRSFS